MGRLVKGLIALLGFFLAFRAFQFFMKASEPGPAGRQVVMGRSRKRPTPMASSSVDPEVLNLNQASLAQLAALPGLGQDHAKKIIKGRPFRLKTDLVRRGIVSKATYDRIKTRLVAKKS